jgi:DNA repair exonuclease SbcCD ATPase subunit
MKLILQNFRCHRTREFNFPSVGTVLLDGPSGAGKTSIFKAINFALFGKEQKVTTLGEKKTKVVLHIADTIITRTKNPSHLTVALGNGDLLQDDAAQAHINATFGQNFLLTSYVAQKSVEGFFSLSDAEKTAFLHKISMQDFDVDSLKGKLKGKVKERKLTLASARGQVLALLQVCDAEPVLPKLKLKFPAGGDPQTEGEIAAGNLTKLEELKAELETLELQSSQASATVVKINALKSRREDVLGDIQKLHEAIRVGENLAAKLAALQRDEATCATGVLTAEKIKRLSEAEAGLKKLRESRVKDADVAMAALREEMGGIQPVDIAKLTEDVEKCKRWQKPASVAAQYKVEPTVADVEKKLSELNEELKEYSNADLTEKISSATKTQANLTERKKFIVGQLQKQCLRCPMPSCKASLTIKDGALIPLDAAGRESLEKEGKEIDANLKDLAEKISAAKKEIESNDEATDEIKDEIRAMEGLRADLQTIRNPACTLAEATAALKAGQATKTKVDGLQGRLDGLQKSRNTPTSAEIAAEGTIAKLKREITGPAPPEDIFQQYDTVKAGVAETKFLLQAHYQRKSEHAEKIGLLTDIEKEIAECQAKVALQVSSEKISELKADIKVREGKAKKFAERAAVISEWEKEMADYNRQKPLWDKLQGAKSAEDVAARAYATAEKLLADCLEAEHVTLQSVVNGINRDLEEYTGAFFDNSLDMFLSTTKETASGDKRFLIDVKIKRNGEDVPLDCLSGGEFDRCALALFLAFNRATGAKLLLLDEALSSLHAESVEEIMDVVREKFADKLVIVTLHQANTGLFDSVIKI